VKASGPLPVPKHLRDSHAAASRAIGAGKGYQYAHNFGGWVEQRHLPEELGDKTYFEPVAGTELELARRLEEKKKRNAGKVEED
jgi:putative ATPase